VGCAYDKCKVLVQEMKTFSNHPTKPHEDKRFQIYHLILLLIVIANHSIHAFTISALHKAPRHDHLFRAHNGNLIPTIETSTDSFSKDFVSSGAWGGHPILLRGAFKFEASTLEDENESEFWPSWNELMALACDEESDSRVIMHDPRDEYSWDLKLGHIDEELQTPGRKKWSVIVNDVDRFDPNLSEWMESKFSMIPQWRRDDAQVSLSQKGGGIGAHVDDYDVFLIQTAGLRRWEVGKRPISHQEESESLIKNIDVRILESWKDEVENDLTQDFVLEPGDVLYIPPRYGHCGTALVDKSMTLSVGLRAPSAKELIVKMIDDVSGNFMDEPLVARYTDHELLSPIANELDAVPRFQRDELTNVVKGKGKELVMNAISSMLDDDAYFDKFFGKLVTESNRLRIDYPVSLNDLGHDDRLDLGIWGDANSSIKAVADGEGFLYAAEGVAWAYSKLDVEDEQVCRIFVDGKVWEVALELDDITSITFVRDMIKTRQISCQLLQRQALPKELLAVLKQLVRCGYLYGSDD